MTARQALRSYMAELQRRLRWRALLRGVALVCAVALLATVVLVLALERYAFSVASLWSARAALVGLLAIAVLAGFALPLARLGARACAAHAEGAFPRLQQRLLTFAERDRPQPDPFLELLAADTLRLTSPEDRRILVSDALLAGTGALALAAALVLLWLIAAAPGALGYGAAALWRGSPATPYYDLRVEPGDASVRRRADMLVTALPLGSASRPVLHARYAGAAHWERLEMQPRPQSAAFQFLFAGIPADIEYYVVAGAVHSPHYHLRVADLASIRHIRVTYHYPAWMRRADEVDERGGDLRAVQGTQARVELSTDRPLAHGVLALDDGREIAIEALGANRYAATVPIERDGAYHLGMHDRTGVVRLSEDYFIEAGEVRPPQVALLRPERDYRASPIEEVTLAAQASDSFGLDELAIHYAVNGGPEQQVRVAAPAAATRASGSLTLALERFHLVPGDVVSVFASARDARSEARSELQFIEIEPFEREFSQSQQAGGGGAGNADHQAQITQRQKEIIAATWSEAGLHADSPQHAAEQAKFLADVQTTLRSQSLSLAGRLEMRDLNTANEQFGRFQQEMAAAAAAMQPAARALADERWHDAVPEEQKALQHLLRAEATYRQIQVAFGSLGAGAGSAGRDLASLFDLELDTEKNQYETRQAANAPEQQKGAIDEALRKLDELARRQSELAAQRSPGALSAEQRWQQEMLRREAEQMRRELEQLSESGSQGAANGASGMADASAAAQPSAQPGEPSQQAQQLRAREALERLARAEAQMRAAVDSPQAAPAQQAARELRDSLALLGGVEQQQAGHELEGLRAEAARLARTEREQAEQLQRQLDSGVGTTPGTLPQMRSYGGADLSGMVEPRQRLADDASRLEQSMRTTERQTLAHSHAAAAKLRDALSDLDDTELETRLQRSADLLRRGYNPANDAIEAEIAAALQRLQQQLSEAQQALAGEQPDLNDPLDALSRVRAQLAALDPSRRAPGSTPAAGGAGGDQRGRATGGAAGGAVRGAGGAGERIWGGWNLGNNGSYAGTAATPQPTPSVDPEQAYRQGLTALAGVRRSVADDPEARHQADALIRAMQQLDPRRFPGNPLMVQELYASVLSQLDRLELQLRHGEAEAPASEVRSEDPLAVPAGYQSAVADYYRRLSQSSN
ncbi:MAG TPA: hypothetical protein VME21_13380 [Steroidobacteraceae bacterium]|nr:hypothetical protein [Steroidobacteraceae bacterium]